MFEKSKKQANFVFWRIAFSQLRGQKCSPEHVHLFLRNTSWRKKHVFVFCKTRKFLHLGEVQKLLQDVEILLNSKTADTICR